MRAYLTMTDARTPIDVADALVEGLETSLERETNADLAEGWALAVAQDWILKHESIYDEARMARIRQRFQLTSKKGPAIRMDFG
jgi:hypothetical protein